MKDSKEVTCAFFDSAMSLQETVYRSIEAEIKRQGINQTADLVDEYINGVKSYRNFIRRPERYKECLMTLRVRMDGKYSGWRLKDELYEAFGVPKGDALYLNDLWVLGLDNIDVDINEWYIDCFATGDAADWIDNNEVTQGTVFEGKFLTKYRWVPHIAGRGKESEPVDAMIAKLILVEGIRVIERDVPIRTMQNTETSMLLRQMLSGMRTTSNEVMSES